MKKHLTILVGIFIILTATVSAVNIHHIETISNGQTLYVGGSGPGNYSTIKSAIDNASNGDTVFVYHGIYFEHIYLNESISLVGENKHETFLDGQQNGTGIVLSANTVTISGFTIQNNEFSAYHGAIRGSTNFSCINNNIVINDNEQGNSYGIYLRRSGYNLIENNTISNCYYSGVALYDNSIYNKIINNTIFATFWECIRIRYSNNNTIIRNKLSSGVSIYVSHSNNNQIHYNHLTNPKSSGSILLSNASKNNITHNNFIASRLIHIKATFLGENNFWDKNYWNRPRIFPKPIFGRIYRNGEEAISINFDWHPAQEPYAIGGQV